MNFFFMELRDFMVLQDSQKKLTDPQLERSDGELPQTSQVKSICQRVSHSWHWYLFPFPLSSPSQAGQFIALSFSSRNDGILCKNSEGKWEKSILFDFILFD